MIQSLLGKLVLSPRGRQVAATALGAVSRGLEAAAKVSASVAATLRTTGDAPAGDSDRRSRRVAREGPGPAPAAASKAPAAAGQGGAGAQSTRAPGAEVTGPPDTTATHARAPESGIAALAERTADEVITAIDGLSTDDLRALFDYEQGHKRRKTVLAAIERAAAPPQQATSSQGA